MKIGPYTLQSRVLLAPMAGITDAPFRRLCRRFGAGMTTSEMTTADIRLWSTAKSARRLDLDADAEPRVVQIAGSDPEQLSLAARLCVERVHRLSTSTWAAPLPVSTRDGRAPFRSRHGHKSCRPA